MLQLLSEHLLSWLVFSIHLFANRGKFKSLGKLSEMSLRVWIIQKSGQGKGSDDRLHKLCIRAAKLCDQDMSSLSVWCLQIPCVTVGYQNTGLGFWLHFSREVLFKDCTENVSKLKKFWFACAFISSEKIMFFWERKCQPKF